MMTVDTSREVRIGRDWRKSIALAALCLGLVVLFAYGTQIEADGHHERRFRSMSLLLLPAFVLFSAFVVYRLFLPWGALLVVGPEGFIDRRAGREPIPWSEIRNVTRRAHYVSLTLRLKYARSYDFTWSQRLLKATRQSAGPSHLLVADWCCAAQQRELLERITAYWQTHGKS